MSANIFEQIAVDMNTGRVTYPKPDGFGLDVEAVYRVARLHSAYCAPEMAVRHAIHGQLTAYSGMMSIPGMNPPAGPSLWPAGHSKS